MDNKIPKKIYLQWYDEDGVEIQTDFMNEQDVLWCEDKINDTDIEYYHVSENERLRKEKEWLIKLLYEKICATPITLVAYKRSINDMMQQALKGE